MGCCVCMLFCERCFIQIDLEASLKSSCKYSLLLIVPFSTHEHNNTFISLASPFFEDQRSLKLWPLMGEERKGIGKQPFDLSMLQTGERKSVGEGKNKKRVKSVQFFYGKEKVFS